MKTIHTMKRVVPLLFAFILSLSAFANNDSIPTRGPRVGLVLGGGGAKGAAHIGVLKYIEELGIPIDYVVGTSMGSIIGGLYALGYSPDEMQELISQMNWSKYMTNSVDREFLSSSEKSRGSTYLLTIPFGKGEFSAKSQKKANDIKGSKTSYLMLPSSLSGGSNLLNLFNALSTGYQDEMDFRDMPIPFACIATNVKTGDEVVLDHGKFPVALRASMSIPGIFDPITIDGQLLMDGGLVNNFPTDRCREMGADIIIGIEVAAGLEQDEEKLKSLPQILSQLKNIAVKGHNEENRKLCNVYIKPDVSNFGMLSFSKEDIDSIVNIGYVAAHDYTEQLLTIKKKIGERRKSLRAPKSKFIEYDSVFILNEINLKNVGPKEEAWLIRKGNLRTGEPTTTDEVMETIEIYRGTAIFSKIEYTLRPVDFRNDTMAIPLYDLNIDFEMAEPNTADLGIRFDTEESATLLFNLGVNQRRLSGFKANVSLGLGYNPFFHGTATLAGLSLANLNFSYDLRLIRYNVTEADFFGTNKPVYYNNALQNRLRLYVSEFHLRNIQTAVGFEFDRIKFFQSSMDNLIDLDSLNTKISETTWGPFVRFKFDNLDDPYFATRGVETAIDAHWRMNSKKRETYSNIGDITLYFKGYIPAGKVTFIPQIYMRGIIGDNRMFPYGNIIGGSKFGRYFDYQLPFVGFTRPYEYLSFNMVGIGRLDIRCNIVGKHYVTAIANFARSSRDIKCFFQPDDIQINENIFGAALQYSYNSLIGPITLDGHWENMTKKFGFYLSIGYDF